MRSFAFCLSLLFLSPILPFSHLPPLTPASLLPHSPHSPSPTISLSHTQYLCLSSLTISASTPRSLSRLLHSPRMPLFHVSPSPQLRQLHCLSATTLVMAGRCAVLLVALLACAIRSESATTTRHSLQFGALSAYRVHETTYEVRSLMHHHCV